MARWDVNFDTRVNVMNPTIVNYVANIHAYSKVIRSIPIPPGVQANLDALNIMRAVRGTTGIEVLGSTFLDNINFLNYPNPFSKFTSIKYSLPIMSELEIKVFNSMGIEVKTLCNRAHEAGTHEVHWNGRDNNGKLLPKGCYVISIKIKTENGKYLVNRKIIFVD